MNLLFLFFLPPDAELPHPGAKGAGVETKEERGPVLPLDAPLGVLEHLEDVVVFHLVNGLDVRSFRVHGALMVGLDIMLN